MKESEVEELDFDKPKYSSEFYEDVSFSEEDLKIDSDFGFDE